jgi:hypothetical protein
LGRFYCGEKANFKGVAPKFKSDFGLKQKRDLARSTLYPRVRRNLAPDKQPDKRTIEQSSAIKNEQLDHLVT